MVACVFRESLLWGNLRLNAPGNRGSRKSCDLRRRDSFPDEA
jgi:hypothetical protein